MKISKNIFIIVVYALFMHYACVPGGNAPEVIIDNTIDTTMVNSCTTLSATHIASVAAPSEVAANTEFNIVVNMEFMDGCGFYAGRKLSKKGYHYYINIATGHHVCNLCTEAIVPYIHTESITLSKSGTYTFHVIGHDGSEQTSKVIIH